MTDEDRCYITAEAGINHNGEYDLACDMIEEASRVGADCVKFQYIIAREMAEEGSEFYEIFERTELTHQELQDLKDYAEQNVGIDFKMTVTSPATVDRTKELDVDRLKIGSANIDNFLILEKVAEDKDDYDIYFSSGMSTITDIERALEFLNYKEGDEQFHLYHCTSNYPAKHTNLNLRALTTLRQQFPGIEIGYSDHTRDYVAAVMSVSFGARIFEKHFTLSHDLEGPDHGFSADIGELETYIEKIRLAEEALGSQNKKPAASEVDDRDNLRRHLVTQTSISKNEPLTRKNLTTKRLEDPEGAVKVPQIRYLTHLEAPRDYSEGEALRWSDFEDPEK